MFGFDDAEWLALAILMALAFGGWLGYHNGVSVGEERERARARERDRQR